MLADGGRVLVADERTAERFSLDAGDVERLYYGFSVLHCLPVGMVGADAAGTGTVMRAETVRRYAADAGFASCRGRADRERLLAVLRARAVSVQRGPGRDEAGDGLARVDRGLLPGDAASSSACRSASCARASSPERQVRLSASTLRRCAGQRRSG